MSYKEKEKYRNWQIWQLNTKNDFVGNMSLSMGVKGVDIPDLQADIDEHMISKLAAFESSITGGSKPAAPEVPVEVPPEVVPAPPVKPEVPPPRVAPRVIPTRVIAPRTYSSSSSHSNPGKTSRHQPKPRPADWFERLK